MTLKPDIFLKNLSQIPDSWLKKIDRQDSQERWGVWRRHNGLPWFFGWACYPLHPLCPGIHRFLSYAPESLSWSDKEEKQSGWKEYAHITRLHELRISEILLNPYISNTCFLNSWHSSGVRVSAFAIRGMTLTLSWSLFMNSMSKGFRLKST